MRARKRDETSAAPLSGLHLSTGPQWIQPTVQDYMYYTRCEGGVLHRAGFKAPFVGKGTAQREITALPGFFFLSLFLSLRSSLTGKWDAGYAASPVSLD